MAAVDQSTSVDEKTRRVRSLLSSYYGVDGAPSQGGSPRSEQSDTPSARTNSRLAGSRALAGLDSSAFDVERCASCLYLPRSPCSAFLHMLSRRPVLHVLTSLQHTRNLPSVICRYLQNLFRTTRLDGLLAKHTEMLSEIKNLDSDMQMLVYENYNRFISATDTVRTMKSNVDGMDNSMQDLEQVTGTMNLRLLHVSSALIICLTLSIVS